MFDFTQVMYYTVFHVVHNSDRNTITKEVLGFLPVIMNDKKRKLMIRIVCIVLAVLMALGTLSVAITAFI